MDEAVPTEDDWDRFHYAEQHSLVGSLTEADRPWLTEVLEDRGRPERRVVALHALINAWRSRGRVRSELQALRAILDGDKKLGRVLEEQTSRRRRNKKTERLLRNRGRRERTQARQEKARLDNWTKWRDELLAGPANAFSPEKQAVTIRMLYLWLKAHKQGANSWNIWDKDALTQAFGKEVADHAEGAFRALWRTTTPVLWVAQRSIGQNEVSERCLYGFSGVSSEAEGKGWADSLSPEEARTAAAYATIELGGFAPFIADLADSHPTAVREVIGRELTGEIGIGGDESYLPTLQSLTNAGSNVKQLINPRLLDELKSWPSVFTDEAGKRWAQHLDNVLYILDETTSETDREAIAQECIKRYEADPVGPVAPCWLKGLFRFDAPKGTQVLTEALAASDDPSVRALAVEIFATLFGQHNAIVVELEDPAQYAQVIGQLVRLIYAVVRRTDDQIHDGVFSPDARDHAERARNSLLSRLLDTPGRAARRVVLELAAEDDFVNIRDRLRLLARQRTAADAEFAPFSPKDVVTLEDRYGAPPQDRDGLFAVMMDRLDDLAIDLADGDFTDRRTVQRINEESEMQRTLARRLKENTNGAYLVTREEEVADQKRTDIRLLAVTGDQKAVVEVKLADKWSLAALDQALQEQLVGRYLRDANCKAGCLLLTYRGEKNYWIHPNTRDRLSFAEAVAYLQDKARILENESPSNVRIAAFGLDLTGSGSRP